MIDGRPYRQDLAYIHDAGYGGVAADAAARLIGDLAAAGRRGGLVVDMGCGSGILAAALTAARYRVLGFDISEAMVAIARRRAPDAEFRVGSFVSAELPACEAITAVGEVVSYAFDPANDEDARAALFRRIHDALAPGGVFLFDVAGLERVRPGETIRSHGAGPDWAVLAESTLDPATRVLTRTITSFRQDGTLYRRDTEVHRLVLLDPDVVRQSLEDVGFEVQMSPRYLTAALPPGVVAFAARRRKASHRMIKRTKAMGVAPLLVAAGIAAAAVVTVRAQDRAAIDHAKHVFELLEQSKYEDVAKEFNAQVAAAMTADQLRGVWADFHGRMGAYQRAIDEQSVEPQPGITAVVLGCQFEKGNVNVMIAFDADHKIAGLRFAPKP